MTMIIARNTAPCGMSRFRRPPAHMQARPNPASSLRIHTLIA